MMDGLTEEIKNMTLGQLIDKIKNIEKNTEKNTEKNIEKNIEKKNVITKYFINAPDVIRKKTWINSEGKIHRDDKPAVIEYDENGNILVKIWYQNGLKHRNNNKPALVEYDKENNKITKMWYQHGKLHRDNDEPAYIKGDPKSSPVYKQWYMNGKLHRENDEPASYQITKIKIYMLWYKDGHRYRANDKPTEVTTTLDNQLLMEAWINSNGEQSRIGGPSIILYNENGDVVQENWFIDGKPYNRNGEPDVVEKHNNGLIKSKRWYSNNSWDLHRVDGPAYILWDETGKRTEMWYQNGLKYREDNKPEVLKFRPDGSLYKETWYKDRIKLYSKYYV